MGIAEIITLIFVVAKVFGIGTVATWSWLWVFSPLWIIYGIAAAILVLAFIVALIAAVTK